MSRTVFPLLLVALFVGSTVAWADPPAARAPGDLLKDRRAQNEEQRRKSPPASQASPPAPRVPATPVPQGSLVGVHHGSVRLVSGLARVDLKLAIQNVGPGPVEWSQTFPMDPRAEVIGAVLLRAGQHPVEARTLTLPDARRLYAEARRPQRRFRDLWEKKDPLRLERVSRDLLSVIVWPVEPQETVEIELTFVTPLRGRAQMQTYVDVLGGGAERRTKPTGAPRASEHAARTQETLASETAEWVIHTGTLVLDAEPAGMTLTDEQPGLLRFVGTPQTTTEAPRPTVPFLDPAPRDVALSLRGGGLGRRVAIWRFDPEAFLASKGIAPSERIHVRLLAAPGSTSRIAPWELGSTTEPLPITARITPRSDELRYTVQVLDRRRGEVGRFDVRMPVERVQGDRRLEGAVTGWHRAALVQRVFDWAGADPLRRDKALRYAVDVGVLVPGTAALAIPPRERGRLSTASKMLYSFDGAPLGAQRREADMKSPPPGSTRAP